MGEPRTCDETCQECLGIGCKMPNEAAGYFRTIREFRAEVGESLLRKSATWRPAEDTAEMSVPEMILHVYRNRKSEAVAPNGHTCPFLTVEEWSRIADWARQEKTIELEARDE